ncbi:hypothetical protein L6452_05636 [Arctium lappa]|uniref:Uncharacterized protein n=1 Tax=Arctium lappa TaxID=4217 RepID=A0ACB9EHM3_ARCLA|nr:hypothetical protein L6452_05636 [Arctium lappa]
MEESQYSETRAPRWRVRGGNPKEEQKEGWVLVGQGHLASNRRGLSSGSYLLAEMNGSEGGWIFYFRAGREVKAIREDCPPGRTRREGRSPSLCPADHSAGISHSRPHLTAARGCSCRYVSLSGSLAPLVISFYNMLLSSPYSICHLVISASLRVSTSERNGGLHSVTPRSPSERSE